MDKLNAVKDIVKLAGGFKERHPKMLKNRQQAMMSLCERPSYFSCSLSTSSKKVET